MNPYEVLGVEKDATRDQVKAAFRRKTKTAHPDRGGDTATMSQLNRAYALLSDDTARARYDRTGDAGPAQSREAKATAILATAFLSAIDHARGPADFVRLARTALNRAHGELRAKRDQAAGAIEKVAQLRGLVVADRGPNLFDDLLSQRERQATDAIAVLDDELGAMTLALDLLNAYRSTYVEPSAQSGAFFFTLHPGNP